MELALGVVEPARAAPSVGASVDGLRPVGVDDAAQFGREQVDDGLPPDGDERLGAAARVRSGTPVEPPGPYHRLRDPGPVPDAVLDVLKER